jgi:hypothetical protein
MKSGTKTTEFWVSIAPVLIGLIEGMKGDKEIAKWLIVCGTALSIVYIASRTFLKMKQTQIEKEGSEPNES